MSSSQQNQQQTSFRFMGVLPWLLLGVVLGMFIWYVFGNTNNNHNSQASISPSANTAQISQSEPLSQQEQQAPQAWQPPRAEASETTVNLKERTDVVSYHEAVAKASQSVVNIYTTQKVADNPYMNDPILRRFFDFDESMPKQDKKIPTSAQG